jgi:transcriptional regulator with PAS, ATPase and Fis domain
VGRLRCVAAIEIGDLPLELQAKLLRAVQEQEFERLGNVKTIQVNVRMKSFGARAPETCGTAALSSKNQV